MIYIQHFIKTVHFWLKYNGLRIVWKTTKLIEGGHRGLQDYRHICYCFYVFNVFLRFSIFLLCFVRYVFSNYDTDETDGPTSSAAMPRSDRISIVQQNLTLTVTLTCCFSEKICSHFVDVGCGWLFTFDLAFCLEQNLKLNAKVRT